jgi:hypothetical protein
MPARGDYLERPTAVASRTARSEGRPYEAEYRIQVPGCGLRWTRGSR